MQTAANVSLPDDPLLPGTPAWQDIRQELLQDLERPTGRIRRLIEYGFESAEMTVIHFRCHEGTGGPTTLDQLEASYGLGRGSWYRAATKILGVLDHVGALPETCVVTRKARQYSGGMRALVERLRKCHGKSVEVDNGRVIRKFGLTAITELPYGMPLSEVPALAAICRDAPLLERLRNGSPDGDGEEALRLRFSFDEAYLAMRSYEDVGRKLHRPAQAVRLHAECLLQRHRHDPL